MSKLVKEDDEFLHLTEYLHHDPDSYSDWMCTPDGRVCPDPKWPDFVIEAADGALYEIEVNYRVRKSDGKVFYDKFS